MSTHARHLVIGSGPAGVSAAMALIGMGEQVTMVDTGLTLEPDRQSRVASMATRPPSAWTQEETAWIKPRFPKDSSGVPTKLLFGSDYPYRDAMAANRLEIPDGLLKPSIAQGGLSTVWGSSVLPYNDRDLERWPISAENLRPHYEAVARWMPLMATHDDLEPLYPIHAEVPQPVRPSRPAEQILKRMAGNREALRESGILFGHSRMAMRSEACTECGLCLYGCPYGLIYNSAETLSRLKRSPGFEYIPGVTVDRMEETQSGVRVVGREHRSQQPWSIHTDRVFLGAGVLPTARITLESAGLLNQPIRLLDSQYTVMPMASLHTHPGIEDDLLHTLCQIYLEINDPAISRHNVHTQVYTYSSLFLDEFRTKAFGVLPLIPGSRRQLLSRLMVSFGYLHSDDSGGLELLLERKRGASLGTLRVTPVSNRSTTKAQDRLVWKLLRNAQLLGFAPLLPLVQRTAPGRGFHNGGSFPMGQKSNDLQSDTLGRPFGWSRIHLIDSSVFPTIPAATITYTAMANAHRIASMAGSL